jgi:ABC-type glycerol-3-phosphate transport system permease component
VSSPQSKHLGRRTVHYAILLFIGILSLFPMYFMAVTGLKNGVQLEQSPFSLQFAHPFGTFYSAAWHYIAGDLLRTALVIIPSVAGIILFGMMSAYAFARMEFLASRVLFYAIFGLLLIPSFLVLIPLFLEVKGMGLQDSLWSLILPYIAGGQAFAMFLFRSSIEDLPDELFEAGRLDGASHLRMLWSIVMPLTRPIMIVVGLINITAFWGDYVFPSLVLSTARSTAAMAIGNFQPPVSISSLNVTDLQFAAYTIVSIPMILLFVIFLKYFITGMASGAVKM